MTKKKIDHLHKYKKDKLGRSYKIFRCIVPGCSHYIAHHMAFNRLVACNRCDGPMVMDRYAMMLVLPHCNDCIKTKDSDRINKLGELFTS